MNGLFKHAGKSVVAGIAALLATAPVAQASNAALYSQEAVQRLCVDAQKVVSSTSLEAININHSSTDSMTFSSAAPYEGPNLSAYNGKEVPGDALPLTTQSFISYSTVRSTRWRYPETVSCKMKDAEAIRFHFGENAAGAPTELPNDERTDRRQRCVQPDAVATPHPAL